MVGGAGPIQGWGSQASWWGHKTVPDPKNVQTFQRELRISSAPGVGCGEDGGNQTSFTHILRAWVTRDDFRIRWEGETFGPWPLGPCGCSFLHAHNQNYCLSPTTVGSGERKVLKLDASLPGACSEAEFPPPSNGNRSDNTRWSSVTEKQAFQQFINTGNYHNQ